MVGDGEVKRAREGERRCDIYPDAATAVFCRLYAVRRCVAVQERDCEVAMCGAAYRCGSDK